MPAKQDKHPSNLPRARFFSVAVVVSDRRRSVEWYTKNLGLDLVQDLGHWVTVGRKDGSGLIHLCQTSEIGMEERPEPGLTGIELNIPGDFQVACAALEANGVKFRKGPMKETWGWWAGVLDPDGNRSPSCRPIRKLTLATRTRPCDGRRRRRNSDTTVGSVCELTATASVERTRWEPVPKSPAYAPGGIRKSAAEVALHAKAT